MNYKEVEKLLEKKLQNPNFKLSPEQTLDVINHCVETVEQKNKNLQNKNGIILIGNSGSGKSTLVNYLAGCSLEMVKSNENDYRILSEEIIVVKPISRGGKKNEIMKIGHTDISETFLLNSYFENNLKYFFIDCPGFRDNRGEVINISNSINIRYLLAKIQNLKVMIVVNYQSLLNDRSSSFRDLIFNLKSLFGNEKNISETN